MGNPFCKNANVYIKLYFQEKKDKNSLEENVPRVFGLKKKTKNLPHKPHSRLSGLLGTPGENLVNTLQTLKAKPRGYC